MGEVTIFFSLLLFKKGLKNQISFMGKPVTYHVNDKLLLMGRYHP